jgi:hypothetical protein
MSKYIIVTLAVNNNHRSLGYGKELRIIQEYRIWQKALGPEYYSVGFTASYTDMRDTEDCPIPKFDTYEEAQQYLNRYLEQIKDKSNKIGTKYAKFFTRLTTIEKFCNFVENCPKPYDYFNSKSDADEKLLTELLGPKLL